MRLRSAIDSDRFGVAVGKVQLASHADLAAALDDARAEGLDLLIARTSANDLAAAHALEDAGFRLMDSILYFRRPLADPSPPAADFVRLARLSDVDAVVAVAQMAFHDYPGHYRSDPRLPRELADGIYPDWARRSLTDQPTVADRVLVAEVDGEIAGFGALKFQGEVADGTLFGVAPAWRGRGVYRELLLAALDAARVAGCTVMEYSTQLTNIPAQRTITRLGFTLDHAVFTFHRWFEQNENVVDSERCLKQVQPGFSR